MDLHNPADGKVRALTSEHTQALWTLFGAIHDSWRGDSCRPEDMASQWREFIQLKVAGSPSYIEHYCSACELLRELQETHGHQLYQYIFFDAEFHRDSDTRLADFKRYVVDEFIRVYVSLGGFRSFGGKNYTGFVSGSRFRSQRPYRSYEDA